MSRFAELPDGRRLEFPDDTPDDVIQAVVRRELGITAQPGIAGARETAQPTREQRLERIAALEAEASAIEAGRPGAIRTALGATGEAVSALRGVPETVLQLATGGAATAAGGVAAIPVTAAAALTGVEDPAAAGRAVIEQFQDIGTFQPRTEVGQQASAAIAAPLEAFEEFADVVGETGRGDPGLDVLRATLVKTAILGAPALFGLRRGGTTTRAALKPTPRQRVAANAAEEGYVTPPSVRGEAGATGLAEGLGGKLKVGQQAVEVNQAVTNKLASRSVGLPEEVPVTVDILQGIRAQAGQAYEAVRGVGQVFTDTVFRKDLSAATAPPRR